MLTGAGSGLGSPLDVETFFRGDVGQHDAGGEKLYLGSIFSEMIAFYPLYGGPGQKPPDYRAPDAEGTLKSRIKIVYTR